MLRGAVGNGGEDLGHRPEPGQAGHADPVGGRNGAPVRRHDRRRERSPAARKSIGQDPYFALLLFMVGTTFYQQRQMQKASPPGAASGQQQAILKLMPLMFGIFGFTFPAGLTLYWTISNLWQIGQQYVLLRAGHIGPDAMERRIAEQRAQEREQAGAKLGFMARMQERAEQSQQARSGQSPKQPPPKKPSRRAEARSHRSGSAGHRARAVPNPRAGGTPNAGGTPKPAGGRTRILGSAVEAAVAGRRRSGQLASRRPSRRRSTNSGSPSRRLAIDVLQEPRPGFLGIGSP